MHGGQAILKAIERSGVDFILSSPGSEWPPVWEAWLKPRRGAKNPKYINCRHEAVAVAMAAGYTKSPICPKWSCFTPPPDRSMPR